jgi:hypothetical protein
MLIEVETTMRERLSARPGLPRLGSSPPTTVVPSEKVIRVERI